MGLYFRKRGSLFGNLLRFSLTGAGLGVSLGVRGFRAGIASSGRRYISASLPGTGLYLRTYAHSHPVTHAVAPRSPLAIPHPVPHLPQPHGVAFAVGTVIGYLIVIAPFALLAWWWLR